MRDALAEQGCPISQSYFSELCRGERTEPSLSVVRALAKTFGVPTAYFAADDLEAAEMEMALRDPEQVLRHVLPTDGDDVPPTLAERLDRCFRYLRPPGGEYTYRKVSEEVEKYGAKMSPSYIWQLRAGQRDNPTVRQVEALARFFHIPATYFLGSVEEVERLHAEMAFEEVMKKPEIASVAFRANDLNTEGLRWVADMMKTMASNPMFREKSGLPPEPKTIPASNKSPRTSDSDASVVDDESA